MSQWWRIMEVVCVCSQGMAFSLEERLQLGTHGLLPPCFITQEVQLLRVLKNYDMRKDDLDRWGLRHATLLIIPFYLWSAANQQSRICPGSLADSRLCTPYIWKPSKDVRRISDQPSEIYIHLQTHISLDKVPLSSPPCSPSWVFL